MTIHNTVSVFCFIVMFCLAGCATATRGSHTVFAIESVPEGAAVTTDLELPNTLKKRADIPLGEKAYYGCSPTPCGIKLPRRSDFNVMVVKDGFQPSTHSVFKDRNDMQTKKTEAAAIGTAAASTVYFGATAISVAEAGGLSALLYPPGAVMGAGVVITIPVVGAVYGIDLASGSLIDLNPNPLNVELKQESSEDETRALIEAFDRSRKSKK